MITAGRPETTTLYRKSFVNKSHPGPGMAFLVWGKSNGSGNFFVNRPNAPLLMPRLLYSLLVITVITLATACSKDSDSPETAFYGMWIKGTHTGDTLYFYKKNGQHIMRSNQSFNPLMYAPVERVYKYDGGKLIIAYPYASLGLPFTYDTIESFTWKATGRQFEVNGIELYMFMSASSTKFTFTKVL
jgi:hypothetical protein